MGVTVIGLFCTLNRKKTQIIMLENVPFLAYLPLGLDRIVCQQASGTGSI